MSQVVSGVITAYAPALTDDGKWLYTACGNEVFKYSTKSGRVVSALAGHTAEVTSTRLLSDGSLLTSSLDGTLKRWREHVCVQTQAVERPVLALEASRDGETVACLVSSGQSSCSSTLTLLSCPQEGQCSVSLFTGSISAFAVSRNFVAACSGNRLFVYSIISRTSREFRHKRGLTAVTIGEEEVATADVHGIIVRWSVLGADVWRSEGDAKFAGSAQHWHSSAVPALSFSESGLLSGGDEAVLCVWRDGQVRKPQFLPRLGAPIRHISTGRQFAAVSLASNFVMIVDLFKMGLVGSVSGLPQGDGVVFPVSSHLLVRGLGGSSLHAFSPKDRRQAGPGILLGERNFVGQAWATEKADPWICGNYAASEKWLAAAMHREGKVVMKFWALSSVLAGKLVSVCLEAHASSVSAMAAGVISDKDGSSETVFISGSEDGCVKIWRIGQGKCWKVAKILKFRDQPVRALTVAGGVVLVVFGNFLTAWEIATAKELTGGIFLGSGMVNGLAINGTRALVTLQEGDAGWVVAVELTSCLVVSRFALESAPVSIVSFREGFALSQSAGNVNLLKMDLEISSQITIQVKSLSVVGTDLLGVTVGGSLVRLDGNYSIATESIEESEEIVETKISRVVASSEKESRKFINVPKLVEQLVDPLTPSHLCAPPRAMFSALVQRLLAAQ